MTGKKTPNFYEELENPNIRNHYPLMIEKDSIDRELQFDYSHLSIGHENHFRFWL